MNISTTIDGVTHCGILPDSLSYLVTWTHTKKAFAPRKIRVVGVDPMLHYRHLRRRRVRSIPVSVGQVFDSLSDAARTVGVSVPSLTKGLVNRTPVGGLYFENVSTT